MKLLFIALFIPCLVYGQDFEIPYPSLSPKGTMTQVVGNTTIEVSYERPSVRHRVIFGALVPYDKVWRTGAGNSTKIRFTNDVQVGGQPIPAGSYSLFTIPNEKDWIVIFNRDTTLYGTSDYKRIDDVTRFAVKPGQTTRFYETMTIDIELIQNNARLYISWANTQVSFLIETTTDAQIMGLIEIQLESGKSKDSDNYAGAASYLMTRGEIDNRALQLSKQAVELDPQSEWARRVNIKLYELLGQKELALEQIAETITMLQKKGDRENEIQELQDNYKRINKSK